jgi:hypothetical protein
MAKQSADRILRDPDAHWGVEGRPVRLSEERGSFGA